MFLYNRFIMINSILLKITVRLIQIEVNSKSVFIK